MALKIQFFSCKIFVESKNVVATPSRDLALRFVVSAIIQGTKDITFLLRFLGILICASNYDSNLNGYAFIFRGEVIFIFSLCLS